MADTAEDVVEKDKLPLKNYARGDSFDALLHSYYIIVLHGADTLVFVVYNTVHLNNNILPHADMQQCDHPSTSATA